MAEQIHITNLLSAGTYSAAVVEGAGVDIRDYVGTARAILQVGASLAGVLPTVTVRLESSGTVAGIYSGLAGGIGTSGTFPTASFAGTNAVIDFETDAYQRYMRAFVSLGGTSPRFPVAVAIAGRKQNS